MHAKLGFGFACTAVLFLVLVPKMGTTQSCQIHYERIDVAQGLSTGYINDIVRDLDGFLWIATEDGINRYDGRSIVSLRANTADSFGLTFDNVTAITPLDNGMLLLGGPEGELLIMDIQKRRRKSLLFKEIQGQRIKAIVSANGLVYVATDHHVVLINAQDYTIVPQPALANMGDCHFLVKDPMGIVWLSTSNGLYLSRGQGQMALVPGSETLNLKDITASSREYWAVADHGIYQISSTLEIARIDPPGFNPNEYTLQVVAIKGDYVLLGSEGYVFWILNKTTNELISCMDYSGSSGFYAGLTSRFQDLEGNLFMGTAGDGVMHINLESVFSPFDFLPIPSRKYYAAKALFSHDQSIHLLVDDAIYEFKDRVQVKETPVFLHARYDINDMVAVNDGYWVATNQGIVRLNKSGIEIDNIISDLDNNLTISDNRVLSLQLADGYIYAATARGYDKLDLGTGLATRLMDNGEGVLAAYMGQKAHFLGTTGGLFAYREGGGVDPLVLSDIDPGMYQGITSVVAQGKFLWVGTKNQGVFQFRQTEGNQYVAVAHFLQGLANGHVMAMAQDGAGRLWVSTILGLSMIDPANGSVANFYENDGLLSDVFDNQKALLLDGRLFLASRRGLVFFNPNQVTSSYHAPKLLLTSIQVAGKPILNDLEIPVISSLKVGYFEHSFSLSFAALEFGAPDKVRYAYKMEGLNADWVSLGNSNELTFSNLQSGQYALRIKAYGSHGNESRNEIVLNIEIKPPFYTTTWFRIILTLLLLGGVGTVYLYRFRQEKARSRILEREVEKRTEILKKQNKELEIAKERALASDKAKSEFMATMSHEIRTPMNGILGSVSILDHTGLTDEQKEQLSIISESGDNMLAIINEILDYSKIESGKLHAVEEGFDLVGAVKFTVNSHASRAFGKGLELSCFIAPNVPRNAVGDRARIVQVLNNIISNAVKFTRRGYVHVEVSLGRARGSNKHEVVFRVDDSGIGIPKAKQLEIWEAFTQVDNSSTREYGGTGLGLAIVKSMVGILGGNVQVKSEEGVGSSFTVTLPLVAQERVPEVVSIPTRRIIIGLSAKSNAAQLVRLAKEWGWQAESLDDMSALNDTHRFDLAFVDMRTLRTEFPEGLDAIAHETVLLTHGSEWDTQPLVHGHRQLSMPIWRDDFEKLFKVAVTSTLDGANTAGNQPINWGDGHSYKVLLAEDNKVNQMVTSKIFKKIGFELDIAVDGKEALAMQQENGYDVILMDLLMPEMDGLEATRQIRAQKFQKEPYIVAFSANIFNKDLAYFQGQGFNNVLSKPAKLEDLSRVMQEAVQAIGQKV